MLNHVRRRTRRPPVVQRLRQLVNTVLVAALVSLSVPYAAVADIYELPEDWVYSSTNPSDPSDYDAVWREGWGNNPLPQFTINIPQADAGQPAIVGAYYFLTRPSFTATIHAGVWQDCYYAVISDSAVWQLYLDVPSEMTHKGPLFDDTWVPPVVPDRPYEGLYEAWTQFVAHETTTAASGGFRFGIDVTPPVQVTGLQALRGPGEPAIGEGEWLTQSRVVLKWDDKVYDRLAGTGYFEIFLDGKPYPLSPGSQVSRKVYDLKEHYPGFGMTIDTKREAVIEDLPAGVHTLQVRAVDRATNTGPLSSPITIRIDPDFPEINVTSPVVDGETMGTSPLFSADVTDRGGVDYVRFLVDGTCIATDYAAPFTAQGNLASAAHGSNHTLRVEAFDMAGRTNFATKTFVLDKKPTASILSPVYAGQTFSNLVPVRILAEDKTGILNIRYRWEGQLLFTTYYPAAGTTSTVVTALMPLKSADPNVDHTLYVTVTNVHNEGVVGSPLTRTFRISNSLRPKISDFQTAGDSSLNFTSQWFNTALPTFTAAATEEVDGATELLYTVDRSPMTVINPANPNFYYSSYRLSDGTTHFNGLIDLQGVYLSDTDKFGSSTQFLSTGDGTIVSHALEGLWYTHSLVRNPLGDSGPVNHTVFGVDLTRPGAVSGVAVYPSSTSVTPVSGWLDQTRAVIRWSGAQVDALSGVLHFRVYIDGEPVAEGVPFEPGRSTMSLTIENLAPGAHSVTVAAVDLAGNEGAASSPAVVKIKSVPTITITSPASTGTTLTSPTPLRATVADVSGVANVTFSVTGTDTVRTFSSADAKTLYCSTYLALTNGTYTLTVTAESTSGPVATASRMFHVDESLGIDIGDGGDGDGDTGGGGPEVITEFEWFNTPFPTFVAKPSDVPTDPTELLYLVDRTEDTPINPNAPNDYYSSYRTVASTTYFDGLVDQLGVYMSDPARFDADLAVGPTQGLTETPLEGLWYIHALIRNAAGDGSPVSHVSYGVDLTAPRQVTGVGAYSNITTTTPVSGWLYQSRVVIRWNNLDGTGRDWDKLSKTHYYKVYVDGVPIGGDAEKILAQSGRSVMSLTVENLTQGEHTIHVAAVDHAGNEGVLSAPVYVNTDIEAPEVAITAPEYAGQVMSAKPVFSADASDEGGITSVRFYVDGTLIATDTEAPYSVNADLSGPAYTDGTTHTLRAEAVDGAGRTRFVERTFVIDKKPQVTIMSPAFTNQAFSRYVPIKALVSDRVGIASVQFRIDDVLADTYTPIAPNTLADAVTSLQWVPTAGAHVLEITVTSTSGGSITTSRSFTVGTTLRPDLAGFATAVVDASGDTGTATQWFNTTFPTFSAVRSSDVTEPAEILYLVDRDPMTDIDPLNPDIYYSSYHLSAGTTHYTGLIDQTGVYLSDPTGFDGTTLMPGMAATPLEGIWYTHALIRNIEGVAGPMNHVAYGIDLSPPAVVADVKAYATSTSLTRVTGWLSQNRVVLRWSSVQADALSGVEYFKVYVDGVAMQDRVPFQPGRNTLSLTIEDLKAGTHQLAVSAVDRAGNEGALSAPYTVSIESVPVVTITAPASAGATMTPPVSLRASITDANGISSVQMTVDGTSQVRTFSPDGAGTYQASWTVPLASGTYTLRVMATSISGPATEVTRTFAVDTTVDDPTGDDGDPGIVTPDMVWFNTAFPSFTAKPSTTATDPIELLYLVDRSPDTPIDPSTPNDYYSHYNLGTGATYFQGVIDQWGVYLSEPTLFDGRLYWFDRCAQPIEGWWYIHALLRTADDLGGETEHVKYGVDVTPPLQVEDVGIYSSNTAVTPSTGGWLDQSRIVIRWDGSERDALSRTAYYNVYVDGKLIGDEQNRIVYQPDRAVMSVTVEDLTPGLHKVEVTAVDKAGNEGPKSVAASIGVDWVAPAVKLTSPATVGALLGLNSSLVAVATDDVGVKSVQFKIDNVVVGTVYPTGVVTSYKATVKPDWSTIAAGAHTCTVYVTDHTGHVASVSLAFYLDKTPPVISYVSGSTNPFYPRIREGYKDNYKVKFRTNEAGSAKLVIRNSKGTVVRTITKSISAPGSYSIIWNGKDSSGAVKAGKYTCTIQVFDPAKNSSKAVNLYTEIRFYEVIRINSSTVKIVQR